MSTRPDRRGSRFVTGVTVLTALTMLAAGGWGWAAPASFARFANWPNHVHFLHDAGAFQLGIGLTMLAALRWRDTITVVLAGFTFTNSLHAVNHAIDLDLGGNGSDPLALAALSVLSVTALVVRARLLRRRAADPTTRTEVRV